MLPLTKEMMMKTTWKKTSPNIWVWRKWRIIGTGLWYLVRSETRLAGTGKKKRKLHTKFCTLNNAMEYCENNER